MTDLRKAAEIALEALDSDNPDIQLRAAVSLRQALSQSEYATEVVAMHEDGTYTTRRTPIQQREIWCDCGDGIMPGSGAKCGNCIAAESAAREWVPLTDADKQEAFDETQEASGGFWDFADYLEAILKEKNG